MRLSQVLAVLLTALGVDALRNASPFLLLSSDKLPTDHSLQSSQIALTKDVQDRLIDSLSTCDKRWYYIFSQEHVGASDLKDGAMPKLQRRLAEAGKDRVVQIPEVVQMGELSAKSVAAGLEEACATKGKTGVELGPEGADEYRIVTVDLPSLPSNVEGRATAVRDIDDAIDDTVASVLGQEQSSVLIYITTPPQSGMSDAEDGHLYEMDDPYPSALHTDLKRDLTMQRRQSEGNQDMQAGLPLFEKYQFLSPPIFMGLGVSLLLLAILYVGLSAVAGLEVSYMAFNKEMGPQAQKGKQQ